MTGKHEGAGRAKSKMPIRGVAGAAPKVIKRLKGVVLVDPDGIPVSWEQNPNRAIGAYALRKSRVILNDDDYATEMVRLSRDGWSIRLADVTVAYVEDETTLLKRMFRGLASGGATRR